MKNKKISLILTIITLLISLTFSITDATVAYGVQTENNSKKVGWINSKGIWHYFNSDGSMKTGWLNSNNTWYYFNSDGSMKTGWLKNSDKCYYFNLDGKMKTGWINLYGSLYYFNSNGIWIPSANSDTKLTSLIPKSLLKENSNSTYSLNDANFIGTTEALPLDLQTPVIVVPDYNKDGDDSDISICVNRQYPESAKQFKDILKSIFPTKADEVYSVSYNYSLPVGYINSTYSKTYQFDNKKVTIYLGASDDIVYLIITPISQK